MDLDLGQLRALAAVVDAGTLEAGARHLHITTSAVSQRLRALEQATGRVLLVRSRPVRPTASGERVLQLARQVSLLVADTTAALGGAADDEPGRGGADDGRWVRPPVLPIAVNADSLATWVLPALAHLAGPEAEVCLDLRREDQSYTARLLRDGSVVGAITSDAEVVPGCSVQPLGALRYLAVATPEVVDRWFADGVTGEALRRAPVVVFDRDDELQDVWLAARASAAGAGERLDPPRHHVPASIDFSEAVKLGWGWALLPQAHASGDLASGRLVQLDEAPVDVPLYWQQWKLRSPALDAVASALVTAARAALVPIS
ncbi:transcriptional regulator, LysR family [Quadrisphaera granulorum]|uniref:LysR family transcriptional regulator n=1 Tax=Quadrisphaera granulorum TaxID=317664 RepID=A0A316A8Y3_9ACTN|nr:LysR family transcriptional regulator ArgP [Quadrisphaera granulorum]PWJ54205.1 LysR family transcriptional regulator [Quadrisphaera granulorum]SZE96344.1 transcriptional regulator, LysR family [Quadrisphaera granulorum]